MHAHWLVLITVSTVIEYNSWRVLQMFRFAAETQLGCNVVPRVRTSEVNRPQYTHLVSLSLRFDPPVYTVFGAALLRFTVFLSFFYLVLLRVSHSVSPLFVTMCQLKQNSNPHLFPTSFKVSLGLLHASVCIGVCLVLNGDSGPGGLTRSCSTRAPAAPELSKAKAFDNMERQQNESRAASQGASSTFTSPLCCTLSSLLSFSPNVHRTQPDFSILQDLNSPL